MSSTTSRPYPKAAAPPNGGVKAPPRGPPRIALSHHQPCVSAAQAVSDGAPLLSPVVAPSDTHAMLGEDALDAGTTDIELTGKRYHGYALLTASHNRGDIVLRQSLTHSPSTRVLPGDGLKIIFATHCVIVDLVQDADQWFYQFCAVGISTAELHVRALGFAPLRQALTSALERYALKGFVVGSTVRSGGPDPRPPLTSGSRRVGGCSSYYRRAAGGV